MSRAVVFDLDGTLIDSAPDIHAAANRLMVQNGFDPFAPEETRSFIGSGVPHFISCCLTARGRAGDGALRARLIEDFIADYETAVTLTTVYPGVMGALDGLAGADLALGLCTNKPEGPAHSILAHLGLAGYFPVIIGGDSLTLRKPDPAPLQATAAALGARDVVFVGDSEVDAETAARAGVPFVLYTEGYRKGPIEQIAHDRAFSDFADLQELITDLLS
ncbi:MULTISPECIES: phosphoglycolate phosphatase [unclassified Roseovarius]|jgi:phosphoglycolate phosphatase|uniref:phosphoglycolate phosphatase n=1 Tax=unclassified Roseovarius TaxID=2614913 RepID=UPI0000684D7E|nr:MULTISPECIES: phosphoglycolate phosphatase [unclassified Roseovarius]EAQ25485.1 phosphoglycolate phosphatase [Roseovarius sp. 217]KJS44577.1 MAG: phosphoglycolate phosphatase [Roseovarius sp. BRH_c41]